MKAAYAGILLCAIGFFLVVFRTEIATLLLGGPPKVQGLMWIEDRQVHEKVGRWVLWSGSALMLIGVTGLAVLARFRSSSMRSRR